jgi:hypothetical protein
MPSSELKEIKKQLIDLYLCVKVRKSEEIEKLTSENIDSERQDLKNLPLTDIINYIQNSIDVLVELRANEKYEQKMEILESKDKYINYEDPKDANGLKLYEGMLIKIEGDLRNHIRVIKIIYIILILYLKLFIYSTNKN